MIPESEVDAEEDEASGTGESDSDGSPKSARGRRRRSTSRKLKERTTVEDSEHECFDLNAISSCSESEDSVPLQTLTQVKRQRGRPPKNMALQNEPGPSNLGKPTKRAKRGEYMFPTRLPSRYSPRAIVTTKAPKARSHFYTQATQGVKVCYVAVCYPRISTFDSVALVG